MKIEQRLAYPLQAKPEMCSLNMGSMNFSIHPVAERITNWRYDWEKPKVEGMKDCVFKNTFADIEYILGNLGESGTRFELECYDVGHLYNLAYFVDRSIIKPPLFIQAIFGILGGLGPDPENLFVMRSTADRLFGRDTYHLSMLGAGRHQMALLTMGAILGANVRVGLEDNLYLGPGVKAKSNAEQVRKIRRILEELSFEIATPSEVREMLHLKGAENVHFVLMRCAGGIPSAERNSMKVESRMTFKDRLYPPPGLRVLVTAGASGIGAAIASAFAETGARNPRLRYRRRCTGRIPEALPFLSGDPRRCGR